MVAMGWVGRLFCLALLSSVLLQMCSGQTTSPSTAAPVASGPATLLAGAVQLVPDVPSALDVVNYNDIKFFYFTLTTKEANARVQLFAYHGDPDLLVLSPKNDNPFGMGTDYLNLAWASLGICNESVTIHPLDTYFALGTYAVGVLGSSKTPATFSVMVHITSGLPVSPPAQKAAISTIYSKCCTNLSDPAVSGVNPTCLEWDKLGAPSVDICQMYGVECNDDGTLTSLDLSGTTMNCTFPFDALVGAMPNLWRLNLNGNSLTGAVNWTAISRLPKLQDLNLGNNGLTGGVPCDLSTGPLISFVATSNGLGGPFPACLLQKPDMRYLDLSKNSFNGSLPTTVPSGGDMRVLNLQENFIGGTLLAEYGTYVSLEVLNMSSNDISGSFPTGFVGPSLDVLDLNSNQLSGSIPATAFDKGNNLIYIDLSGNHLTGTLPAALTTNPNLISVILANNQLSGGLSTTWGTTSLVVLDLSSNQLSGPIPYNLLLQQNLLALFLQGNRFSGPLPDPPKGTSSSIREIDLSDNQLYGTIPSNLQLLPVFDPNANDSVSIGQSILLQFFGAANNQLTGPIPAFMYPENLAPFAIVNLTGNPGLTCNSSIGHAAGGVLCSGSSSSDAGTRGSASASGGSGGGSTSGISAGGIVGIVIAVLAALGLVVAGVILLLRKRRQAGAGGSGGADGNSLPTSRSFTKNLLSFKRMPSQSAVEMPPQ